MKGDLNFSVDTEIGKFSMRTTDWVTASLVIHEKPLEHYIENPGLFAYKETSNWVEICLNDEVIGVLNWQKYSREAVVLESIEIEPSMIGKGLLRKIYTGLELICHDMDVKSLVMVHYSDTCEEKFMHIGFQHCHGCLIKDV